MVSDVLEAGFATLKNLEPLMSDYISFMPRRKDIFSNKFHSVLVGSFSIERIMKPFYLLLQPKILV